MLVNKALCAALVVLGAVATTGHAFTYQVKPSSNEILEASGALVVRWENRPGNSPDSMDVPVPAHVTVNLGYRKGNEAVLLYPPLSGTTSTVPVSDRVFSWKPMNFAMFETSEPLPPRDLKTQWFIQLKDQDSGYISNGNLFRIRGDDSSGAAASISAPAFVDSSAPQQAAPAAPAPSAPVPSNAAPNNAAAPAGAPAAAPAAAPATSSFSGGAPASNPSAPASNPSSSITQGTPRSAGTAVTALSVALVAPLGVASVLFYTASR